MNWQPLLKFDREGAQDVPFALGFECGRLWEIAKRTDEEFTETVHVENVEMVLRIGEALGREVKSEELGGDWLAVTFGEALGTPE